MTHDLHPSKELSDAQNFNLLWIFYALLFEVLLLHMYPKWSVAGVLICTCFLPLVLNGVWLLLPFYHKRKVVISNNITFSFYCFQAILIMWFIGCAVYFFASTISYPWTDAYLWSNMWLMQGAFLTFTAMSAAIHSYTFTILVFKYRRHLRRTNKPISEMIWT